MTLDEAKERLRNPLNRHDRDLIALRTITEHLLLKTELLDNALEKVSVKRSIQDEPPRRIGRWKRAKASPSDCVRNQTPSKEEVVDTLHIKEAEQGAHAPLDPQE